MTSLQIPTMRRKSVRRRLERSGSSKISLVPSFTHINLHQGPFQLRLILILIMLLCTNVRTPRCPFGPAAGAVRRPHGICATLVSSLDIGAKTVLPSDNTRPTVPVLPRNSELTNDDTINDKYFDFVSWCDWDNELDSDIDIFLKQVDYLEKQNLSFSVVKGVKGRLAKNIAFWEKIGANSFVLDTIRNGFVIPFIESPNSMHKSNNRSAVQNSDFVTSAIDDLVSSGCAVQVPFKPFIVNPLSVSIQKSGKKRLILDLSILNLSVKKEKIKFEDWKIAIQYFEQNTNLYKFDLKSGYFHLDICPQQQTYLGFSWKEKFLLFYGSSFWNFYRSLYFH